MGHRLEDGIVPLSGKPVGQSWHRAMIVAGPGKFAVKTRLSTVLIVCFLVTPLGAIKPRCRLGLHPGAEPAKSRNHESAPVHRRHKARQLRNLVRIGEEEASHCPRLFTDPHGDAGAARASLRARGSDAAEYAEIDRRIRPFLAFQKRNWNSTTCCWSPSTVQVIFSLDREDDLRHQPQKRAVQGFTPG